MEELKFWAQLLAFVTGVALVMPWVLKWLILYGHWVLS